MQRWDRGWRLVDSVGPIRLEIIIFFFFDSDVTTMHHIMTNGGFVEI